MGFQVPYINTLIEKFWYVVLTNRHSVPNFTDLINLADSIVKVDNPNPNNENLIKLNLIRKYTHPNIEMNIASFELWVSRNWHKSINKELDFIDGKTKRIHEIAEIVDEVIRDLCRIVSDVGKKYSLQIQYETEEDKKLKLSDIFNMGAIQ